MALSIASGDYVSVPTAQSVLQDTAWTYACWFKQGNPSGLNRFIVFDEGDATDRQIQILLKHVNSKLALNYRASNFHQMESTNTWADDAWHRLVVVRRAQDDYEMWVDGTSEATYVTATGTTSAGNTAVTIANNPNSTSQTIENIARFAAWDSALSVTEADNFLLTGKFTTRPLYWMEGESLTPLDHSGNDVTFTPVSLAALSNNPPMSPPRKGFIQVMKAAPAISNFPFGMQDLTRQFGANAAARLGGVLQ